MCIRRSLLQRRATALHVSVLCQLLLLLLLLLRLLGDDQRWAALSSHSKLLSLQTDCSLQACRSCKRSCLPYLAGYVLPWDPSH